MRILCVTLLYPPHHLGGYERVCQDVLERMAKRGHEVLVLTSDERQPGVIADDDERASSPSVWRELRSYHAHGQLLTPPRREQLAIERHNQAVLARALDEFRPDVVTPWHMGALSTGLLSTLVRSGLPLVYGVCDDWPTYLEVVDPWARRFRSRPWLGRAAERVAGVPCRPPDLGPSGTWCYLSDVTRRRCLAVRTEPHPVTTVIYSGVDLGDFSPRPRPPEFGWRLLYAGRPDPRKGIATLLRALPYLPRAELTIYLPLGRVASANSTDDEHVVGLRALAADLGVADRVVFAEGSGRAAMADRYAASDIVIFPSEWAEPFGLVPVEAMACAVPVVASGVGGSGEYLVDGGNCVLFEPGDPVSLAAAVVRLAEDDRLRARIGEGGLATARELDIEHTADDYERWFEAAADGFRSGQPRERRLVLPEAVTAPASDLSPDPPPLHLPSDGAVADVRVGIVSWNVGVLLDRCLMALPAALGALRAEVVVVDNASTDDSAEIAARHPGVTVVSNPVNAGYAKAMNQALAGTDAEVLIALNPDTVVPPGGLATLVRRLLDAPDVGLVAPRLLHEDGQPQHSVYRWPSATVGLASALVPVRWQAKTVGPRLWLVGACPHDTPTDVDWVIGAVHVIRREALAGEPPFDERWFMYVEDIELCWRLARRGWRRRLEADVEVRHVGGASSRQRWDDPAPTYFAATYDWFQRDRGRLAARRWALANTVGVACRASMLRVLGALTRSPDRVARARALRPMLRLHAHVLRHGPTEPDADGQYRDAGHG